MTLKPTFRPHYGLPTAARERVSVRRRTRAAVDNPASAQKSTPIVTTFGKI